MVETNLAFSSLYSAIAAYSAAEASYNPASNFALKLVKSVLTLFNNSESA